MATTIEFIVTVMFRKQFWLLLLASFTAVLMLAWRSSLRDDIFKMARPPRRF